MTTRPTAKDGRVVSNHRCPLGDECLCWQEGYRDGVAGLTGRLARLQATLWLIREDAREPDENTPETVIEYANLALDGHHEAES